MLDRCKFITPPLEVHPEAVHDFRAFGEDHGFPLMTTSIFPRKGAPSLSAAISPLADDAVCLVANQSGKRWFSGSCVFTASALLDGYNGGLTKSSARLQHALSELQAVLKPLLRNPGDAERLIPGVDPRGSGHWKKLEISADFTDPDGILHAAYQNCRHPSITLPSFTGKNGSRKLPGSELWVNFYSKDQELQKLMKKFDAPQAVAPVERIEFTLFGQKLVRTFQAAGCGQFRTDSSSGQAKLTSFSVTDLRDVHRFLLSQLKGFFMIPSTESMGVTAHAAFIALLARNGVEKAETLINQYHKIQGGDGNTRKRLRSDVMKAISEMSSLRMEEWFNDEAYAQQPSIRIPKLENATRKLWRRNGINPDIARVYGGDHKHCDMFVPHVSACQLI